MPGTNEPSNNAIIGDNVDTCKIGAEARAGIGCHYCTVMAAVPSGTVEHLNAKWQCDKIFDVPTTTRDLSSLAFPSTVRHRHQHINIDCVSCDGANTFYAYTEASNTGFRVCIPCPA
jgi:hypothetical protein